MSAVPLSASIGTQPQQFQQPNVIATGSWPASIESADLNGDGRPDLVYTDYGATATASTTHILLNNGDGTFAPGQSISTAGASVVVADFDRDGHPDLEWVWSVVGEGRVYFARGNGDGTFTAPVMLGTFAQIGTNVPQLSYMAAAAMHPSGYLDLLVEDVANSAFFELTADSSGVLVRLYAIHLPHEAGPMYTADLNGDGNTDLVIQSSVIDVFFGSVDGILGLSATYKGPSGVRGMLFQDVDSDGHPDILVEGTAGHLDILHGNPDGTFNTASSGGTGSLDPATGAGGHPVGLTASGHLYTATPTGIGLLQLQSNLSLTLQGLYNAGPSPALGQSSYLLADFNGDGSPDLAIDSPEGIAILYSNLDGSLQTSRSFSSNRPALNATLGAFTAAGSLDALLTLVPAQPQLMHGNGDGTFSLPSAPLAASSSSATASGPTLTVDLNNDGVLDLILSTTSGLLLELGNGDGTFGGPSVITSSRSNAIAMMLSSRAAIATSDASGEHVLTAPALTSTTIATGTPGLVAAGDLNQDGANDLLYQNGAIWTVYLNRSGSFTPVSTLPGVPTQPNLNAASALIADLDGDGNGDVVILFDNASADHAHPSASAANQLLAWYGNGDGTFTAPVAIPLARNYTQLAAAQIQNSGVPDLVLSDGFLVGIVRNLGGRVFSSEQHLLAGGSISSISTADLNHDGTNDLVLSNGSNAPNAEVSTGGITVLLNKLTPRVLISTTTNLILTTPTAIIYGQVVDGYAQVQSADSSALSGNITFYDGTKNICSIPVTSTVSCPASAGSGFTAGQHTLTAVYSGDATHAASTSAPVVVTVQSAATTATLSSSLSPAPTGQAVTFSAVFASTYATPSGTVDFYDSGVLIGSGVLDSSGTATFMTSTLTAGTHSINASFAGSSNFQASSSLPVSEVITAFVTATPTATMVSSSANPSTAGQSVSLTANVVATTQSKTVSPTGSVTFYDGSTVLGTANVNSSGLATITTSSLAVGAHSITAAYAGDTNFAASTSAAFAQTVNASAPPTAVSFVIMPATTAVTVETGNSANILVKVSPVNGFNQPVALTCSNLPDSSTCAFAATTIPVGGATTTLKLATSAPRACGSSTSYAQAPGQTASLNSKAVLPFVAPALAGLVFLFVPKRRRAARSLLTLIGLCGTFMALSGCGACTDLGTRPGSYSFTITGTSTGSSAITVTQTIKVTVTE